MKIAHCISPYDELSQRNGSAVLRVAAELSQAARDGGEMATIVGGKGRLVDLPGAIAGLSLRRAERLLSPRARDAVDNGVKLLTGFSPFAPSLDVSALPFHPDVVCFHNLPFTRTRGSWERWLYVHNRLMVNAPSWVIRKRLSSFDRIISVSNFIADDLAYRATRGSNSPIPNIEVVWNGVSSVEDVSSDAGVRDIDILFVGRLVPEKGIHVLLEALGFLHPPRRLQVTLVGGSNFLPETPLSDYEKALRKSADALVHNITFTGAVPSDAVRKYMQRSRILVVPSVWPEPFGLVVLEGLVSGASVITSRAGALNEIAMRTGLETTEIGDPHDLASKLSLALNSGASHRGQDFAVTWARDRDWHKVWREVSGA